MTADDRAQAYLRRVALHLRNMAADGRNDRHLQDWLEDYASVIDNLVDTVSERRLFATTYCKES